jgi:hypothetical protein
MMKYIEAFRLGIALLGYIAVLRQEGGDKESALLGLGSLIARAAGAKEEEVSILSEEFKKLWAAISALRSN